MCNYIKFIHSNERNQIQIDEFVWSNIPFEDPSKCFSNSKWVLASFSNSTNLDLGLKVSDQKLNLTNTKTDAIQYATLNMIQSIVQTLGSYLNSRNLPFLCYNNFSSFLLTEKQAK